MKNNQNDIYTLPLITTRNVVFFPNFQQDLEIGRQISVTTLLSLPKDSPYLVLVSQIDPNLEEITDITQFYKYATVCKVLNIKKKNNYYVATILPAERCEIVKMKRLKEKMICDFFVIKNITNLNENQLNETSKMYLSKIHNSYIQYLKSIGQGNRKIEESFFIPVFEGDLDLFLNDFSLEVDKYAKIFLNIEQQAKLLSIWSIEDRCEFVLSAIDARIKSQMLEKELDMKLDAKLRNISKKAMLKEKLDLIKEELNEGKKSKIDKFKEDFEKNPYPEHIKEKVQEEFYRFESAISGQDAGVVLTYLQWLQSIPWYQESIDNEDLNVARDILDKDHYGLKDVKERILEYLAVKKAKNSLKSPILCLVGPPGVGKTSIARSIARATNRNFVKASLGGVHDEAEIRGHRRTYIGAMPGKIIQSMKKAKYKNPVFLLDEIDKMTANMKGDPASALLEVLDPEQNSVFVDNFIEEEYDLSKVLFVATANYIENIPAPLKDRLEIIELNSYVEDEKLQIALNHLLNKQLLENGLKSNQISLSKEMILFLIRYYTKEAGVRQLERLIATIVRKSLLEIFTTNKKKIIITKDLLIKWLGNEKVEYGKRNEKNKVGVVTGLAYTSFGGDVLQIEVNYFKGKGQLVLTGKLGEVMKESAQIALDYIKSNCKKYNIDPQFFINNDIHIHVPEGAVPKDGPSAGVTLATALVSAITSNKVDCKVAMTGELTLTGEVLAIGGLKEKSIAAHRSGIKKIFIPESNKKDLKEVPETVKNDIEFIPVKKIDSILENAILF